MLEAWQCGSRERVAQRHRLIVQAEGWAVDEVPIACRRRAAWPDECVEHALHYVADSPTQRRFLRSPSFPLGVRYGIRFPCPGASHVAPRAPVAIGLAGLRGI